MLNNLVLLAGVDIPFPQGQITIHTPRIKEIGLLGEDRFFTGCSLLNFSKDSFLNEQDKINLKDKTDFDIFMSIIQDTSMQEFDAIRSDVMSVIGLLFPEYEVNVGQDAIYFKSIQNPLEGGCIDNSNYPDFKSILKELFCLDGGGQGDEFNPKGDMARKIANKLQEARRKITQSKGNNKNKISILSMYTSILTVGLQKDINDLMNYTVYQLYEEFQRYQLKVAYDIHLQARMAGAKDVQEVDNWMKDLHSESI